MGTTNVPGCVTGQCWLHKIGEIMPKYIINEGLQSEEVIVAASAIEGNIQWWFYDADSRAQETRLKGYVQTIRESRTFETRLET
jgi:hypothetical protein